ncbi:unnamed protein product [Parnassius apollo]|uniref:(apollo) hypothetical protein n=1 Tax=Parnassius apollo TaxID=110799 RepID=A0A8S3X2A8_PARAO|nr:unnamed protein product [Parnassius apollo]
MGESSKVNVTVRNKLEKRNSSLRNISYSDSDSSNINLMPETSPRSLPDTTLLENSQIIDFKNEIDQLTLQLTSAHNKIMELNLENTNLRKTLEQYQKKERVYKKLLDSPLKHGAIPKSCKKKKPKEDISSINQNSIFKTVLSEHPSSDLTVQEKHECSLKSKEKTITIKTKVKDKNQILIVGDQQALGMASALMKIRSSYKNPRQYNISAFTYPDTPTDVILKKTTTK